MISLICHGCQTIGAVNRVTAGLRCTCGSDDLDVYEPGVESFLVAMGAAHGPGTGWGQPMPDPLRGWTEYAGPHVHPNPFEVPKAPQLCPECKGVKMDMRDGGICRLCKGSGQVQSGTAVAPPPLVPRHPGPSTQTTVPFVGRYHNGARPSKGRPEEGGRTIKSPEEVIKATTPGWQEGRGVVDPERMPNVSPATKVREDFDYSDKALRSRRQSEPYAMHEAHCPGCGHAPTHLVNDYKDDAWWHCPNCGPLANVDRNPQINPYDPPNGFKANPRSFKATRMLPTKKTGRVLKMLVSVVEGNPGLTPPESLSIVRATVQKYPE